MLLAIKIWKDLKRFERPQITGMDSTGVMNGFASSVSEMCGLWDLPSLSQMVGRNSELFTNEMEMMVSYIA